MASLKVLLHNATPWGSACHVLRLGGPARHAGLSVVQGSDWHTGALAPAYGEDLAEADLVVVQRDFPAHAAAYSQIHSLAAARGKPVVYDLDDLLIEVPAANPYFDHFRAARPAMLRALAEADAVTVSTPALAEFARRYNPRVWVLPNTLDDGLWQFVAEDEAEPGGPVVIGYMGGRTHAADVESIAPALARILDRYGGRVALRFWGSAPPPAEIAGRANVAWDEVDFHDYAEFVARFSQERWHIGLAPLQDLEFNRCKSAIKFLEYSARGLPAVYSRLASYARVVSSGENGFLAGAPEEWEAWLARLIDDPDLRHSMGRRAQETARHSWLMSARAGEWLAVYREICAAYEPARAAAAAAQVARRAQAWQAEAETRLAEVQTRLAEAQARLAEAQAEHAAMAARLEQVLAESGAREQALADALRENKAALHARSAELAEIKSSAGWRWLQRLWRLRLWLAPRGSRRERALGRPGAPNRPDAAG